MTWHTASPYRTFYFQTCLSQFLQKKGTSCLQPANHSSAGCQGAAGALQTLGKSLTWFSWGGHKLPSQEVWEWDGWTIVKSDVGVGDQGNGPGDLLRNFPTPSSNSVSIFTLTTILTWLLLQLTNFTITIHIQILNFTDYWQSCYYIIYKPDIFQFTLSVKKASWHTSNPNRNYLSASDIPAELPAHGYYRSPSRYSDHYKEQFLQISDERLVLAWRQCNKHTFQSHFCQVPLLFAGQLPERIKMLPRGELSEGIRCWSWTSVLMDLTESHLRGCQ